jgi:cell cycle arrest protein BUB2
VLIFTLVGSGSPLSYVQGMNVVCAPFLYVMPEVDAFFAFSQFAKSNCPLYFNPGIEGAFAGLKVIL